MKFGYQSNLVDGVFLTILGSSLSISPQVRVLTAPLVQLYTGMMGVLEVVVEVAVFQARTHIRLMQRSTGTMSATQSLLMKAVLIIPLPNQAK